jgi:hypothetical protein
MLAVLVSPLAMAAGKCSAWWQPAARCATLFVARPADPKHLIGANVDLLRQVAGEFCEGRGVECRSP